VAAVEDYCRQVEAHLCRKNDGHLIRIVGPAFEQVCGWAIKGVPLTVATRGIDRYFERYYAKGPRRRPIRIEFCEADVMDVFDDLKAQEEFVSLVSRGISPVNAGIEVGWSPRQTKKRLKDEEFADVVATGVSHELDVHRALYIQRLLEQAAQSN